MVVHAVPPTPFTNTLYVCRLIQYDSDATFCVFNAFESDETTFCEEPPECIYLKI